MVHIDQKLDSIDFWQDGVLVNSNGFGCEGCGCGGNNCALKVGVGCGGETCDGGNGVGVAVGAECEVDKGGG